MNASGLDWIYGTVIGLYICLVLGIGWYHGRRQKSTDEYFVGNRAMSPSLIGISMFATLLSTITYLALPGEYVAKGPVYGFELLGIVAAYFVVGYWIIPVYMRRRVTSAYELIEDKLGLGFRLCAATIFLVIRLAWMSLLIYMASKAILAMLGLETTWLPAVVFTSGGVAILYASIGGMRAVVITDLLQSLLLFGGAALVVATITLDFGGFGWFPTSWQEHWDTQPLFSLDPNVRVTAFGTILGALLWWMCTSAGDQTAVQRFMATGSEKAARRSFLVNSIAGGAVAVMLALVGFSLMGYFQAHPEQLSGGRDVLFGRRRSVSPLHRIPTSERDFRVCSWWRCSPRRCRASTRESTRSAPWSSPTSSAASESARSRPGGQMLVTRLLAIGIGLIVVLTSSFLIPHVPGNFVALANRITNLLISPLFLIFFMALFVPFSTRAGTLAAVVASMLTAVTVAYLGAAHRLVGRRAGVLQSDQLPVDSAVRADRRHRGWLFGHSAPTRGEQKGRRLRITDARFER